MAPDVKALVFDLGGVLLNWDRHNLSSLSGSQFLTIMNSTAWHSLDRGTLTLKEACKEFGELLDVEPAAIEDALEQAQSSLVVNLELVQTLLEVKALNPDMKLYVMSNISREHYIMVQKLGLPWAMFDFIFISGLEGMRKPDLCFFQHVIQHTGLPAHQVLMIDDTVENICAARSLGMRGILVNDQASRSGATLQNLLGDPLPRAETFLRKNARTLHCVVEGHSDVVIKDNFAQLMIWELTGDENIVYVKWPSGEIHKSKALKATATNGHINGYTNGHTNGHTNGYTNGSNGAPLTSDLKNGLWNYFYEDPVLVTRDFPPDADTTSTAYLSIPPGYLSKIADVELVLAAMATNVDPDGIMQTYFASDRPRTTPEVCCNILRTFYRFGYGSDPRIRRTEEWVVSCLQNNACLHGNRHYSTPESFLYFVSRLYVECRPGRLASELEAVKGQLEQRIGVPTNPLSLALRIYACQIVGLDAKAYRKDFELLLTLQERDGGWPAGHFCCVGKTGARIGNRGLTTALAAKIIKFGRSAIKQAFKEEP
ncbi:HAD-like protein [Xylaria palmicola]|nr:HAD-like protein [Xylaria palmicola]